MRSFFSRNTIKREFAKGLIFNYCSIVPSCAAIIILSRKLERECSMSTVALKTEASTAGVKSDSKDLWAVLAGLRGLFAFIVLAYHVKQFVPHSSWLNPVAHLSGFVAVVGFFVISGYSIAHSIEVKPQGFYLRRAERIYPLYLLSCLLALTPFFLFGHQIAAQPGYVAPTFKTILGNLFFLNGVFCDRLTTNAPMWTLSIEVFFYVLAPLFRRMHTALLLGLIAVSSGMFYMHDRFHVTGLVDLHHGLAAAMLLWAWLSGFVFYRYRSEWRAQVGLMAIGTYLLSRFCPEGLNYGMVTYSVSMFAIITAPQLKLSPEWRNRLNYAGEISYPLYIVHFPILVILTLVRAPLNAVLFLIVPLLAAAATYHLIDQPFRARRSKSRTAQAG